MNHVITIGRQFGSGGHEVGLRLANHLGIPFYDKEILTLTAESSRFAESYLKKMDEKKPGFLSIGSSGIIGSTHISTGEGMVGQFYNLSPNDQVFIEQSKVMKDLASKGPCVIIGRCADYVLKDFNTVDIFISASLEERIKRKLALGENDSSSAEVVEKLIKQTDKNRAKFYQYYSHQYWGDSQNYDLSIDTSAIGVDGAVEVILLFLEKYGLHTIMPDK
ncbi:MAG: cytidylate kinase-like family protein [Sphaerochaetaceae bacterium]|nr:cytidylate kinase-like family protein [Sphaerochaetaceae bacterium]